MAAFGTRLGTELGTRLGTRLGSGGDAPAVYDSLVVESIRADGYTVPAAYSRSKRISGAYTGPLIGVRNGGGVVAPIGSHPTTHLLDVAAIATHCGATNGTIATDYDQSGNGHHRSATLVANEPKIYDGTTGVILESTLPVALHSSASESVAGDLTYTPASMLGLTGKPSLTVFTSGKQIDVSVYQRFWTCLGGGTGTGASFHTGFVNGRPAIGLAGATFGFTSREFTAASPVTNFGYYISQIVGSSASNTLTMRQNGVLLASAATLLPLPQVALAGDVHGMGGLANTHSTHGRNGLDAYTSTEIYVEGYAQGAALEALVAEGDAQLAAAGVTPVAHDLTTARPIIVFLWGQSNAALMNIPETVPTDYGFGWAPRVVRGATPLEPYFMPGGEKYLEMVATISALDPDVPCVLWKIQGEADADTAPAGYADRLATIYNSLRTDTNRPDLLWLDTLLHDDFVAVIPGAASVNAQILDFVDSLGSSARVLNPTEHGDVIADHTHYTEALQDAMVVAAHAEVIAAGWR
jgi:hypothetical protein